MVNELKRKMIRILQSVQKRDRYDNLGSRREGGDVRQWKMCYFYLRARIEIKLLPIVCQILIFGRKSASLLFARVFASFCEERKFKALRLNVK